MEKRDRWLFLARLLGVGLVLGYLWTRYRFYYPVALGPILLPLFHWVGVEKWYMALLLDHFTNWVVFVAFVLASPGLIRCWKRSLAALFGGLAIILAGHFLLSWAVYELASPHGMTKTYYRLSQPLFLLNDILPLILWLLFYPDVLGQLLGIRLFRPKTEAPAPTKS